MQGSRFTPAPVDMKLAHRSKWRHIDAIRASVGGYGEFDAANEGPAMRSPKTPGGREGARGHHGRTGTGGVSGADRRGSRQGRQRQSHHDLSALAVEERTAVGC